MLRDRPYRLSQPARRSPLLMILLVLIAAALLAADQARLLGPLRLHAQAIISPVLVRMQQMGPGSSRSSGRRVMIRRFWRNSRRCVRRTPI